MASVFSRLIVKNPVGVAFESLLFLLAFTGLLVMLVFSFVSVFLAADTWAAVLGLFQGVLPAGLLQLGLEADAAVRLFYVVVAGFALVLVSMVVGVLYNLLLAPFLRQRNVSRLAKEGFEISEVFQGRGEWAVLDKENRHAFFVTAARALQVQVDEIRKVESRSMPLARQLRVRVDLTDPDTPYHEVYFKAKDQGDALRIALQRL
ncbi:MAG: hypothetical protein LLP51_10740 [Halorhodospira halophila]|uniref:hypothetical protein n=1 Tax=Halorhodospira TaxID=85108 RepID=UPI0019148F31|nr:MULTISPECIES: hypothetical protein [Halorhodospira]MBK5935536.1 hypothetical protein [Halorhodospira halophila]MBK5942432.1 hypothetical protein [Halorhodospira halophila]MCC3751857.1 hypothetical protein [Halorhodospira halophila]MCG5528213.1 hypothetical protein [Halorhodospira halophila]MCG5537633.1 hypothetical protein [Halorhodospira sp. 9622]